MKVSSSAVSHLAANINRDADDHGRNSNACDESDANWSSDQGSQLPQNLLLPAPRLLSPKCAAGGTKDRKQEERREIKEVWLQQTLPASS